MMEGTEAASIASSFGACDHLAKPLHDLANRPLEPGAYQGQIGDTGRQ